MPGKAKVDPSQKQAQAFPYTCECGCGEAIDPTSAYYRDGKYYSGDAHSDRERQVRDE